MNALLSRIRKEHTHFSSMPPTARMLTLSYFLRSAAYPLIGIFTGAFIWNANHNLTLLTLYYVGNFAALPVVFLINRELLRRFHLTTLYGIGTVFTGVSSLMVIFHSVSTPVAFLVYGALYGLGNGLYWANRNVLTLAHTTSGVRAYFTGLQFSLSTIASVIVPVLAGWFIVLSPYGYQAVVLVAFALLLAAGAVTARGDFGHPEVTAPTGIRLSQEWTRARLLSLAIGSVDSLIYILPTVLVLNTVGNEGILGTLSSAIAIVTAVVSYIVGRLYRKPMFSLVFPAMLAAFSMAGVPILLGTSVYTVAWYLIVINIADSIIWIANEPVLMDMQEEEAKRSGLPVYSLIIDREWFINTGRVLSLAVFLPLTVWMPTTAPAIAAVVTPIIGLGCAALSGAFAPETPRHSARA